jgi:hypothetical protein
MKNLGNALVLNRKRRGQSLVELVCGLLVLIPIILVLFDLAVIVLGVQLNDSTCREAARVASLGDPLTASTRAQAVIDRANASGSSMLSNFKLVKCVSTVTAADIAALGAFGGPISGSVTVDTEVDIRPFVVAVVWNGGAPLTFRSEQTFPFTFVVPNSSN